MTKISIKFQVAKSWIEIWTGRAGPKGQRAGPGREISARRHP